MRPKHTWVIVVQYFVDADPNSFFKVFGPFDTNDAANEYLIEHNLHKSHSIKDVYVTWLDK